MQHIAIVIIIGLIIEIIGQSYKLRPLLLTLKAIGDDAKADAETDAS